MKKVTSVTTHMTAEGQRMSITYSVINEQTGKIESQNNRESYLVTSETAQAHIDALTSYARDMLNEQG